MKEVWTEVTFVTMLFQKVNKIENETRNNHFNQDKLGFNNELKIWLSYLDTGFQRMVKDMRMCSC